MTVLGKHWNSLMQDYGEASGKESEWTVTAEGLHLAGSSVILHWLWTPQTSAHPVSFLRDRRAQAGCSGEHKGVTFQSACVRVYYCSVAKSCPTWLFSTPWTVARQASLSFTTSQGLLKFIQWCYHLILCCPLLLLPSMFPRIKVFSSESALCDYRIQFDS